MNSRASSINLLLRQLPSGQTLLSSAAEALRAAQAPVLQVSEWADAHRVLSRASSAEPGRWSTARTPYLREIMDCLSPASPVQEVVLQKGTQIGGTEVGLNWVGHTIDQGQGPMMIVLPTSNAAKKASKTRVGPMIADTPRLRGKVRDAKSRDSHNTTLLKEFDGGVLIFAGANSATELKSSPVGKLFLDEIEEYPADVDGQGDPEELAEKRTDTFARRKKYKVSTPTIAGGRIDRAYKASDQRLYYVPCPLCGHEQPLRWEGLKWETRRVWEITRHDDGVIVQLTPPGAGAAAGDAPAAWPPPGAVERDTGELVSVWYECESCLGAIHEHAKTAMLNAGRWMAHNPGPDRAAGFKLNSLYSPIGWFGWRKVVLAWLRAQKDTSGALTRTFWNTILGEAYEEPGETIDEHWLKRRIEAWRVGERVPAGALLLAAGVDVQGDRLEARVWGYGRNAETWLVDVQVIHGSPAIDSTWLGLEALLDKAYPHELGGKVRVHAIGIDAGDGNTTHFVRAFVRKWRATRRVLALKGQAVQGKPLLGKPTEQDVNWRGKLIKRGVLLWPMGSDTGKAAFYARLRIDEPGPGFVHLPSGLPDEEFAQLTAEKLVTRYLRGHPKREWELPRGKRNEALDCRVMADAVAEYLGVRRAKWDQLEAAVRVTTQDLFAGAVTSAPQGPAAPSQEDAGAPAAAGSGNGEAAGGAGADGPEGVAVADEPAAGVEADGGAAGVDATEDAAGSGADLVETSADRLPPPNAAPRAPAVPARPNNWITGWRR
jgi:phage terminase large subunit GpA-like protein